MAWMLQIMATIAIRYLYIFHPGFMAETRDQMIILATRCFVGIGALASIFLNDYGGEGGPDYMYLTNSDSKTPQKSPTYWLTKVVLTLNVLLLIFTQVKIEMFKKQTNPNGPTNNLNRRRIKFRSKNSIFGNKAVAITLVLLLAFLLLYLDWAYFPTNIKSNGKTLRTRAIGSIIMQILFPLLWIRKNKNIQDFFLRIWFSKIMFHRPIRASKNRYRYRKPVLSSIPNTGIEIQEIPVFRDLKMGYFWQFLGENLIKSWKFFNFTNLDNEILLWHCHKLSISAIVCSLKWGLDIHGFLILLPKVI